MKNLDQVLAATIRTILTDRATGSDINQCQHAGLDIITACRNLYGWTNPADNIARGEMNAAQFAQALHLAQVKARQ